MDVCFVLIIFFNRKGSEDSWQTAKQHPLQAIPKYLPISRSIKDGEKYY